MHPLLLLAKILTAGLGLAVVWKAFKAYRRFEQEPMLFVAIGFGLVSIGAVLEGIFYDVLLLSPSIAGSLQTGVVATGMVLVLYSLYGNVSPDESSPGESHPRG